MKKFLAISALLAVACNSAMAADTVELTTTVEASCGILTESATSIEMGSSGESFDITYSCNIQPQMTISSENGGLVAEDVSSRITYDVNFSATARFNSSSFDSLDGHTESATREVTPGDADTGASVIYFGNTSNDVSDLTTTFNVFLDDGELLAALPGEYSDTLTINIAAKL